MRLSIHPLLEGELEVTDAVVMAAYDVPYSRKEALRRYLALQPDGAFVVKDNGYIIGFGAAIDYGPFAYIGLMSVHPTMQKRGIGQLLLEHLLAWLDDRGCATILLDASAAGAPLYDRYGFQEDDQTVVLQQTQQVHLPHQLIEGVSCPTDTDFRSIVKFDTVCFGAERQMVLASYRADDPQCVLLTRNGARQVTGYAIAQSRVIGPWIASTVKDAEQLLISSLTFQFESHPSVFTSARNVDALQLLADYGFIRQRSLSHMWKGKRIQRKRETVIYGQTSLGLG